MRTSAAYLIISLGILLTLKTGALAACRDCDWYTAYCSGACGAFAFDKWKCVSGDYAQCNPRFSSCRVDSGGWVIQDCDSWCDANGDCLGAVSIEEPRNGVMLASWTNEGPSADGKVCLEAGAGD